MTETDGTDPDITVGREGSVMVVTMMADRRMNAQRRTFWAALRDALTEAEADSSVRTVVITGDGDRAFSAGGDIHGYLALETVGDRRDFILDCMRTFQAVEQCSKPVIAAVNGIAFGGGLELSLACDVIIASDQARFGVPEARIGLAPGFGVYRLLDHLGAGWARYLVYTGEHLDAARAERIGLVQEVVPHAELHERALALGERIGQSAPIALATAKAAINGGLNTRYLSSVDAIAMLQSTEDADEGVVAFQEKRPPRYEGR
ncbi:MAG: enoyl-CoA hydratase/isomerase family protein [Acidimicrobiales bacterium]